jgi:hypothetical protein
VVCECMCAYKSWCRDGDDVACAACGRNGV